MLAGLWHINWLINYFSICLNNITQLIGSQRLLIVYAEFKLGASLFYISQVVKRCWLVSTGRMLKTGTWNGIMEELFGKVYKSLNKYNHPSLHMLYITKTRLYNFDPLKPHFYIVKLGFTGVYIIFLILLKKHRLWVLVRTASPRRF